MSPTSIGGGHHFGFLMVGISPASLKRTEVRKFLLQPKNFLLMRYKPELISGNICQEGD